ncbi:unnamed protein product, partial [Amoebophrya sp. A25]
EEGSVPDGQDERSLVELHEEKEKVQAMAADVSCVAIKGEVSCDDHAGHPTDLIAEPEKQVSEKKMTKDNKEAQSDAEEQVDVEVPPTSTSVEVDAEVPLLPSSTSTSVFAGGEIDTSKAHEGGQPVEK